MKAKTFPPHSTQTDPRFPTPVTNRSWTTEVNYTTDYERDAGRVTAEFDYVSFECPEGYVFKSNVEQTNVVHAFCHNQEWILTYDPETYCARKCRFFQECSSVPLLFKGRVS